MKYSLKQNIMIVTTFIILLITGILTIATQFPAPETLNPANVFDTFFNLWNGNRTMIFFFVTMVLAISNLFTIPYYKYYHNRFLSFVRTRITYRNYAKKAMIHIFITSFLFYLCLNLAVFLIITLLYTPNYFPDMEETYLLFHQNSWLNFILYCIVSSFGFSFYQLFLFVIIPLIKNEFLYRGLSFLHFILGLLSFLLFSGAVNIVLDQTHWLMRPLGSVFVPLNLYTPGLLFEENGMIYFMLTAFIYLLMTIAVFAYTDRKLILDE